MTLNKVGVSACTIFSTAGAATPVAFILCLLFIIFCFETAHGFDDCFDFTDQFKGSIVYIQNADIGQAG